MRSIMFCRMRILGPCLAIVCLLLPGCSKEELPKTYLVKGKCVLKNGKPLAGGFITFTSVANAEHRGYATIEQDGTFTLDTIALRSDSSSEMLPGAVEGEFSVNIRLDPGAGDSSGGGPPLGGGRPAFTLAKKYRIEAKEINELTVIVE